MSKKQKPIKWKVGQVLTQNRNETMLNVYLTSRQGMQHNESTLKVRKHGPIGSNHNELALKVRRGVRFNHNETTRKIRVKNILMCEKTRLASEMYHQARRAEQEGKVALAEVQYLQSRAAFEEVGGAQYLSVANILNALTVLRWSRKDYAGALRSAKESAQIMENHGAQVSSADEDFIYSTSCELMDQIQYEMSLVSVR